MIFCWNLSLEAASVQGRISAQGISGSLPALTLRECQRREKLVQHLPMVWETHIQVLALRKMWFHLQRRELLTSWVPSWNKNITKGLNSGRNSEWNWLDRKVLHKENIHCVSPEKSSCSEISHIYNLICSSQEPQRSADIRLSLWTMNSGNL